MDFIDCLPKSDNHTSIFVIVDRLSKAAHIIPLTHPYTAKSVASKFIDNVVKLHGIPQSIVSDRDPVFVSSFWRELWRLSGTNLRMSSAYHPQTDGQTEVVNRCLEQYLRCFTSQRPKQWTSILPWAEYWYNTTYHASTGMTPFKALYGRDPPSLPGYERGATEIQELDEQLIEREAALTDLKTHLERANNRMKQAADSKRRDISFDVGDWVYLRLQPYRQHTIFRRTCQKLSYRYYGQFQVEARIGPVAYRLKLPEGSRVHYVFHVSLLKKRIGSDTPVSGTIPPLRANGSLRLISEKILELRRSTTPGSHSREVLVQWLNLPLEDATWEDCHQLQQSFPSLNLEDKILLGDGSNDANAEELVNNRSNSDAQNHRRSNRQRKPNRKYLGSK